MDFNSTIDLIIKDLDEAREIIDDLKKYPGVPALQVELAKSKCKAAGEIIALLKSHNFEISPPVKPVYSEDFILEDTPTTKEVIEPPVTPEVVAPVVTRDVIAPPVTPEVIAPPVSIFAPPVLNPSLKVDIKKDIKKIQEKDAEATIIADKFSSLSSLNEQLRGNITDDDISEFLKTKPITRLSEAIGVNDRFLFIREIFDGNKDEYAKAITRLDNVESLSDARAVIMSYTGENNDNEAVQQLLNIVKRKIPSDE